MAGLLESRVAVITGGTRGLGYAIAEAYAAEGAAVVVASRSPDAVARATKRLESAGCRASGLACDVSDMAQVRALADHARDTFGRLDIWVNNAGIAGAFGPTLGTPAEHFMRVIQTNIVGTYNGSRVAMQHFVAQGRGKLINLVGRGDRKPTPLQNAYAPSKAWVRSFTLALAEEYRTSGVGVFAFNPGLVVTELLTEVEVVPGYAERLRPLETVIRLWGNLPAIPAHKAVWLASAATDGKTGLEVRVLTPARLIGGVLREGVRRLLRRPAEEIKVNAHPLEGPV